MLPRARQPKPDNGFQLQPCRHDQGRCLVALGRAPEATAPLAAAREIFWWLGAKPARAETDEQMEAVRAVC
jgi:hypothetical protein